MSSSDGSSNLNLNSTKSSVRPSHEALESNTGDATDVAKTEEQKIDRAAGEMAQRSTNRIHHGEERNPEDTIFSK